MKSKQATSTYRDFVLFFLLLLLTMSTEKERGYIDVQNVLQGGLVFMRLCRRRLGLGRCLWNRRYDHLHLHLGCSAGTSERMREDEDTENVLVNGGFNVLLLTGEQLNWFTCNLTGLD